jgi:hypothetical protein
MYLCYFTDSYVYSLNIENIMFKIFYTIKTVVNNLKIIYYAIICISFYIFYFKSIA